MIIAVGKPAVEVRLERPGPAVDPPRAVLILGLQEESDAAGAGWVRHGDAAGLMEGEQGLAGRPRVALKSLKLSPAPVLPCLAMTEAASR